jgi:hypothetical protein
MTSATLQLRPIAVNPQAYVRPPSLAIIPYTLPVSAQEFVNSEIRRGIITGVITIEQLYRQKPPATPAPISAEQLAKAIKAVEKLFNPFTIDSATFGDPLDRLLSLSGFIHTEGSDSTREMRQLNGDEIVEVFQGEAGFTTATDKKPVLATFACDSCVGVGGFDPINQIAFLVHFSMEQEVQPSGQQFFCILSQLVKKPIEKPLQIHLRTGCGHSEGSMQKTIQAVKTWMASNPSIPMELASETLTCSAFSGGNSLMIDARTGVVTEYDPSDNSKARKITPLDDMRIQSQAWGHVLGSNQGVYIVYQPG